MDKKLLLDEFEKCISLWEKKGYCGFGGQTNCEECASLYLLYKMLTGEQLHVNSMTKLSLNSWQEKLIKLKKI